MNPIAIIPARYASTRFPGKPLAMLGSLPVIIHVIKQTIQAIPNAVVATDDVRIADTVMEYGYKAILTDSNHPSGTHRIREALDKLPQLYDIVVNVQGDEPFIRPDQIRTLVDLFQQPDVQIATLAKPILPEDPIETLLSPNNVKVVLNSRMQAMYFSRASIPFLRNVPAEQWPTKHTFLHHIGIYAYRSEVLRQITTLPPSPLEQAESLEQLRWLWHGFRIQVALTSYKTIGIDTPEDLSQAQQLLQQTT